MKGLGKFITAAFIIGQVSVSEAAVVPWSLTNVQPTKISEKKDSNDYSAFYAVDLSEELPSLDKLRKMYVKNTIYDKKYEFSWNIGHKFDEVHIDMNDIYADDEEDTSDDDGDDGLIEDDYN